MSVLFPFDAFGMDVGGNRQLCNGEHNIFVVIQSRRIIQIIIIIIIIAGSGVFCVWGGVDGLYPLEEFFPRLQQINNHVYNIVLFTLFIHLCKTPIISLRLHRPLPSPTVYHNNLCWLFTYRAYSMNLW